MGIVDSIWKDRMETIMAEGSLEDNSMEKSSEVLMGKGCENVWNETIKNEQKVTESTQAEHLNAKLFSLNVSLSITRIREPGSVLYTAGDKW